MEPLSNSFKDEPNYSEKQDTEMLEDWLYYLASRNGKTISSPLHFKDYWANSQSVQLIFNICNKLKLTKEVRYVAVELFDRYLYIYAQDLHNWVNEDSKRWTKLEENFSGEMFLRIVSCIQLSSKFTCHYKSVNVARVNCLMQQAGFSYGSEHIVKSELTVLKALDYKIDILTPLSYMETLLEILSYNFPEINPSKLYDEGVKILDWTYLSRSEIYNLLCQRANKIGSSDENNLRVLKGDYLYLAVAVIAASSIFVCYDLYYQVLQQLHLMIQIPKEDIEDFCQVILKTILQ